MNLLSFSCVLKDAADLANLVPAVAAAGFEGLEPTFTLQGGFPSRAELATSASALRQAADAAGLRIPSLRGGPAFWDRFASPDATLREEAVELGRQAFETLRILGGSVLLAVPGRWTHDQTHASAWKGAVETARQIGAIAEAAGLTLALENVENEFLTSPREWRQFLTEVNHPSVGLYFDVGNAVRNRQGPPDRWIEELAPLIRRIHFKGAIRGGAPVPLLEGDVDWPRVVAALRAADYTDWIGVELTPPPFCVPEWLKGVRASAAEILNLP